MQFKAIIRDSLERQEQAKNEVTLRLQEFQKEQQRIVGRLKELLDKGEDLTIGNLRLMLKELNGGKGQRLLEREVEKVD
jgi:hypothetical protein